MPPLLDKGAKVPCVNLPGRGAEVLVSTLLTLWWPEQCDFQAVNLGNVFDPLLTLINARHCEPYFEDLFEQIFQNVS